MKARSLFLTILLLAVHLAVADQPGGWVRAPEDKNATGTAVLSSAGLRSMQGATLTKDRPLSDLAASRALRAPSALQALGGSNSRESAGQISAALSADEADAVTPEIQALADGLLHDWQNIFIWIRSNIDYVHYYGSRKGAQLTLLERSGNDADQSALLVALLRASGISAGYLERFFSIPWSAPDGIDLAHWFNIDQAQLGALISARSIPSSEWGVDPAHPGNYAMRRIIVEATINGAPLPLDPSFKLYQSVPGTNLRLASGFAVSNALSGAGGSETGTSVSNLSVSGLNAYLDGCSSTLETALRAQLPNGDAFSASGGYRIAAVQPASTLPLGFYYPSYDQHWSALPANLFSTLRFTTNTGLDYTINLPELAGRRLSVEFNPSQRLEVWKEDQVVAQESTVGSGDIEITLRIHHPDPTNLNNQSESKVYKRIAGSRYLIPCSFEAGTDLLKGRQRQLESYRRSGLSDSSREVVIESLNIIALSWLRETELAGRLFARADKIARMSHHRVGRVAQEVNASGQSSYYLDVGLQRSAVTSRLAGGNADPSFVAESFMASAMEHGIISQLQGPSQVAASTIRLLRLAASGPIYRATPATWATVRGALRNYQAGDLATLDAVFATGAAPGNWALVPAEGRQVINSWAGAGYSTYSIGSTGMTCDMRISGGLSGGFNSFFAPVNPSVVTTSYRATYDYISNASSNSPPITGGDPVDMASGQFTLSNNDLSIGGALPRGLSFGRRYHGGLRYNKDGNLGYGWDHTLNIKLIEHSNYEQALGGASADEAVVGLLGSSALLELCRDVSTARKGVVAALAAQWLMDRLQQNAQSLVLNDRTFEFLRKPNGTYAPPRGSTLTLAKNAQNNFEVKERHGNTYRFDSQSRLWQVDDLWGRRATFSYGGDGRLLQVADAYNRTLGFSYNAEGQLGLVADNANGRSIGFIYGAGGDLTTAIDAEGNPDYFDYDSAHRLIRQKDGFGRVIVENTNFDAQDRIAEQRSQGLSERTWKFYYGPGVTVEEDPRGGQKAHLFDDRGRPNGEIDPFNQTWSVEYDGQDHVVRTVTPLGEETRRTYDLNHNVISARDEAGTSEYFAYDAQFRLLTHTDRNGRNTAYTYNAQHQPLTVTNPAAEVTTMTYDAFGNLKTIAPPNSPATTYTYDAADRVTRISYPDGTFTTTGYNAVGDPVTATDARGNVTTATYNKRREMLTTTAPGGLMTRKSYDSARNVASTTNPRGKTTFFSYSPTRKLLATTLPGGAIITNHYDERDWADQVIDPLGHVSRTTFQADGKPQSVTDPLGRTESTAYDTDRRPVLTVDPLGSAIYTVLNPRGETLALTDGTGSVDASGNSSLTIDGESASTTFGYDNNGNQIARRNRRGGLWQFGFDNAGRLLSTTSPLGRATGQAWNNRGLLGSVRETSGDLVSLAYDSRGRISSKTGLTGGGATAFTNTFTYDGNSNLLTVTEGTRTLTRTYDALNRVATYRNADNEQLGYSYDANGNLTVLTYPDGKTVTYAYDDRDRLISVKDWANRVTTFAWDANSRLIQLTRPNGTRRSVEYDAAGQVTRLEERRANTRLIYLQQFTYDAAGRVAGRFVAPVPQIFTEPALTATYDLDDRMSACNGQALNHDADGNLLASPLPNGPWGANGASNGASGTFVWDTRNRLTSVTRGDTAQVITYAYDSEGFLTSTTVGGQTTRLTVDPHGGRRSQVLVRTAPDGGKTRYVHGLGLLYEERPDGTLRYYHYDVLGSTIALTDAAETTTGTVEYGTFGALARSTGDALTTPFLWEGRHGVYTDKNTGLHQMRARWYSAQLRRFLNPDPSGFTGGSNFYAFANGDPVSMIDPFGLCPSEVSFWDTGLGKYFSGVGNYYKGYGDAVGDLAGGIYHAGTHPIQTVTGLGNMAAHPINTGRALAGAVGQTFSDLGSDNNRVAGKAMGNLLLTVASLAAPYAKAGQAAELAEVANVANQPVVIGENMARVNAYAARVGGETFKGAGMDANRLWIQEAQASGRQVIDIGPDFARRAQRVEQGILPDSLSYNMERLETAGSSNYLKLFERSGKYQGGVPGLDF
ncbi:MAG: hypothetical protein QOE70_5975 [Chthoniobacter sp.]|jgi:RHS repeat-associated protein|nr:hypothetical protein [Chthoniobacter sp.]